ncbi:amino acid adenylation domain-containing protein, partial [Streptomyces sp. KLOTTS4A1]|uniref:amino acid adenylation domain-containing protein n=1 Tax=Streptomyces sp. KLOTTS4A1 TaxID=3390996 RepID=UPI0039F4873B
MSGRAIRDLELLRRLARHAATDPESIAVLSAEARWTYREFDRRTGELRAELARLAIGAGDVVAVHARRTPELALALVAVARSGAAFMVCDAAHPVDRLRLQAEAAAPAAWLSCDPAGIPAGLAEGLPVIDIADGTGATGAAGTIGAPGNTGAAGTTGAAEDAHGSVAPDAAYVTFTSGTTGRPRGILGTWEPVEHFLSWYTTEYGLDSSVRGAVLSGLGHDPLLRDILVPLWCGGTVVFPDTEPREAHAVAGWLADERISLAHLTPGLGDALADCAPEGGWPALRLTGFGGEQLRWHTVDAWEQLAPGTRVLNLYGTTETPQAVSVYAARTPGTPAAARSGPGVPLGPGIDGVELLSEDGELVVRTRYLARYLDEPRGEGFGGSYRTGDLVRGTADGSWEFTGRRDDQLSVRGHRLEPAEIEGVLATAPGVARAAVAVHDGVLVAHLVAAPGHTVDEADVLDFAAGRLPGHAVPARAVRHTRLPLTPNGKTDRAALRAAPLPTATGRAPRGVHEELLCTLFAEVTGAAGAGPDDDFFALGGDSLTANRLVNRVRRLLGRSLPVAAVFDAPTPARLAPALAAADGGRPALTRAERPPTRLPLSSAQRRLWFVHELDTDDTSYNIALTLTLSGPLDRAALAEALGDVTDRHEVLRTLYRSADGEPYQVILDSARPRLHTVRTSPEQLPDELTRQAGHRFDLAAAPPLRAVLLATGPEAHTLLLLIHHIATDGASTAPLARDLSAAYTARHAGHAPDWDELPVQYADFTLWQQSAERPADDLAYWERRLDALPEVLELPTDRPRPAVASGRGGQVRGRLTAAQHQRLQDLARTTGTTLFMMVRAGLAALLTRLGAGEDIPLGTATAGRADEALDALVGCFANTVCLRTDTSGDPTFRELLGRVRAGDLADFAHQDQPLDRLVEHLNPARSLAHHPLFQTMLTFSGGTQTGFDLPELDVRVSTTDRRAAKVDLSFLFEEPQEPGGPVTYTLEYAADLFDHDSAERLAARLIRLLEAACNRPDLPIGALEILDDAERQRLLVEWNGPRRPVGDATLPQLFERQVRRTPDAPAVEHAGVGLSYRELNERANRIARRLIALGAGPERYVAVALDRGVDLVAAILGILKTGAAYLPLDPAHPAGRIDFVLSDVRPVAAVTSRAHTGILPDELPALTLDGAGDLADLRALSGTDVTDGERTSPLTPAHPAYAIFTSGSTGRPKGVVVEHRSLNAYLAWAREAYDSVRGRALVHSPVSFDLTVTGLFAPLTAGGTVHLTELDGRGPEGAPNHRPQFVKATPSHLPVLLATDDGFSPTGQLVLGGESLMGEVLDQWRARNPGVTVVNEYGPTETTVGCTEFRIAPGDPVPAGVVTIGRPVWNTRMYVLDAQLRPVPASVPGELYIAGDLVTRGYHGRPALTAGRFVADPYGPPGARMYRSGDLARWNSAGLLEFIARVDHQVKVRGFRIEPGEIESVLGAHPDVRAAAVVVREDRPGDPRIVGYAIPHAAGQPTAGPAPETLRAWAAQHLPASMVPAAVVLLDAFPATANGKLDRDALPAPEEPTTSATGATARTAREEILCGLFAEVLGVPQTAVDGNFFDLGGHSLLATRLTGRIRSVFGVDVTLRTLFEAPTPQEMATRLDTTAPTRTPLVPRPRPDVLPLAPAQHRLWFLDRLAGPNATYNVPLVLRLTGRLDEPALRASLSDLVARHEALRTLLPARDGVPRQEILSPARAQVPLHTAESTPQDLEAALEAAAGHAFALDTELPLRATLLRTAPEEHTLLLLLHHTAADGWSMGPLLRDLSRAYTARLAGSPPDLPELTVQYADYALWQSRALGAEDDPDSDLARQVSYWKKQLSGTPELIDLPLDRPRPAAATHQGGQVPFRLRAQTHRALRSLARAGGSTMFMTVHAALTALLTRVGAGTDIPVGTAVAGRGDEALDGLVGFFVNTLVLRTDTSGDPSFRELLERVRDVDLAAFSHQDVPFERVVELTSPARSLAHHPLFQVMLVQQDDAGEELDLPGLTGSVSDLGAGVAKFDLVLSFQENDEGLGGELGFATDVFDRTTAEALVDRLVRLLEAAADCPDRPLSALGILSDGERHTLLNTWNDTDGDVPDQTLPALFAAQAARTPDAPALRLGGETLRYAELDRRANRFAHRLLAKGVRPESRVALYLERSFEAVVAILGILKAGALYVPLDVRYPADRLRTILEQAQAALIVTDRDDLPLPAGTRRMSPEASDGPDHAPPPTAAPGRLAYAMFTSGSTGTPKGVAVTHRNIAALAFDPAFRDGAHHRVLLHSPLAFDASTYELWVPLLAGGEVVIAPPGDIDLDALKQLLAGEGLTAAFFTTALFNLLAEDPDRPLSALREVWTGGETGSPAAMRRAVDDCPDTRVVHVYGPTESTTFATCHPVRRPYTYRTTPPIGGPMGNTTAYVLDAALQPVPVGVPGEL